MNISSVKFQLQNKYPGKRIIITPPKNNSKEIISEIDPSTLHKEYSVCITVFDEITPHFHKKTTETYKVLKGIATIFLDGKKHQLQEGETLQIKPGIAHFAEGNETWIRCSSRPGWVIEDHFFCK